MDKRFGLYIVLGLILGSVFGSSFDPAIGNTTLAMKLGTRGVFIGWFIAGAVIETSKGKNKASDQ